MRISFLSVLMAGILVIIFSERSASQVINAGVPNSSRSIQYLDSLRRVASSKSEDAFDIPGITRLRKAIISSNTGADADKIKRLEEALNNLHPKETPYGIVVNINQDPSSQMAFNWFTNAGVSAGKVQIIKGSASTPSQFLKPLKTVEAKSFQANDLNYSVKSNGLLSLAGIADNAKRSYTVNKAIVTHLKPNTEYSFRVGNDGHWSEIGTFKTAPDRKADFSFLYTTDPQANNDEMFNISQKTTHAAQRMYPGASFWLACGDLVQSDKSANSEWEWEQFFSTQQDLFLHIPFAPVLGNHDKSENKNFTSHFNTSSASFDSAMSTSPGSVYSFVYGNALFLALSFEDYNKPGYLESLAKWMKVQVSEHPKTKWRIAYYHKTLFTGSHSHQGDSDGELVRDRFAPLFDSLKIDLALQGHDHIYEVIGPVKGKMLVPGALKNQLQVPVNPRENVTGRLNGVFNVKGGTLYFLNNSAGKKKYEPKSKAEMDSTESNLGMKNYYGLFSGRFGQTGRPTFSNISVTRDTVTVSTFEVYDESNVSPFDKIKLVK